MASREKKLSINRKQASASPVPPKETLTTTDDSTSLKSATLKTEPSQKTDDASFLTTKTTNTKNVITAIKSPTGLSKRIPKAKKPTINNTLAINLKAKNKKSVRIKQQITKGLLNATKVNLDGKKPSLLRNGVKQKRIRTSKKLLLKNQDLPPILEPVLPLDQVTVKRTYKKRIKKIPNPLAGNVKKVKTVTTSSISSIDETITSLLSRILAEDEQKTAVVVKKPRARKPKVVEPQLPVSSASESIEDVMKDLSSLIKDEAVKQESDALSESGKTEVIKPKKTIVRKPKIDLVKKRVLKKENSLSKDISLDASAIHLIDMLDLSVVKKTREPIYNRRHSIEKFPIDSLENSDHFTANIFTGIPRAVTPKSKRGSKSRQSFDSKLSVRKHSPYTTRSDSPSKILRNGKHRKPKDVLLEGLDGIVKRRRRLCSDFSGSEKSVSKLSGYESDSSYSDKASCYGVDNMEHKDNIIKTEPIDTSNTVGLKMSEVLERRLSSDNLNLTNGIPANEIKSEPNYMDNNSNLCTDIKTEVSPHELDNMKLDESAEVVNPSSKVPEKSIILDIMKQAFNDINQDDQDKRTTRSSIKKPGKGDEEKSNEAIVPTFKFYGGSVKSEQRVTEDDKDSKVTEDVIEKSVMEEFIEDDSEIKPDPDQLKDISNSCQNDPELTDVNFSDNKDEDKPPLLETPENLVIKENILQALGLQSLKAAEEAKIKGKPVVNKSDYTGTLKTVIKLNRCEKKKRHTNILKLTIHKNKNIKVIKETGDTDVGGVEDEQGIKNLKEGVTSNWRSHTTPSSDTAGALRKSHYFNRSNNMDGSSEHTSDGDTAAPDEDGGKLLVIPEKASSFSIHPGRLCKDECSHCFGKFGLFDTPCHIAQMKSIERQDKILKSEKHLTRDSCLCDACYRHVDRKSNTPSYLNKGSKRSSLIAPGPRQNHCHVLACDQAASNILRRKWLIKMRKSVCEVINIDLDNPGLHSIPLCDQHYSALEHLMVCAMCKRKLARNHIHYIGPETDDLTKILNAEGIPVKLVDKPVVCKFCKYFATLALKPAEEHPDTGYYEQYKKKLLHFHGIETMDEEKVSEPIQVLSKESLEKEPFKRKKRLQKSSSHRSPPILEPQVELEKSDQSRVPSDSNSTSKSRSESPSDYMVDYNTLIPSIAMECGSDVDVRELVKTPSLQIVNKSSSKGEVKEAVDILKTVKIKSNCDNISKNSAIAVQRLGSNPCISVRQLFPGEEELGLQGNIEFGNIKEKTPEGWEKCVSTIQYDTDTKLLWQELQKPYGNQSSFLRHLILLEKYFRSGDLLLSPNASHHSINYSESVQNRLHAYDNIPGNYIPQVTCNVVKKSCSGIISTKDSGTSVSIINAANIPKNTPITISQINNLTPSAVNKSRNPGVPPGLISLHPGTTRPTAPPLIKMAQAQKIKIPLTKNWRPNLIPIDPSKKSDKKPGYVKVISAGKPYHITIDDYNRMCAIKKSYDLKQKRLMEAQATPNSNNSSNSTTLKTILPRKGLTISKTATITSPKSDNSLSDGIDTESNLEKLDRTVENLESKLAESTSMMNLPKIPKSLTVIPQTVATHKPLRQSSPTLMITSKPKPSTSKS